MLDLPIYMDHHATTPVDPRVVEAMLPFFTSSFGNPSSRQQATAEARHPFHVVTMTIEHHAVLDPCRRLEREGIAVSYVEPRHDGICDVADIERVLRPETRLVSVMAANNEIGVLQPIAEIAGRTRPRGILLHTDAAQAVGKVPIDVAALGVDLLSLTAHKMWGPKGIGALYVRRRRPRLAITPLFDGGGHEQGLRSGTPNVPGIVGLGAAAAICRDELASEARRVGTLRDRLLGGLRAQLDGVTVNGSLAARLPHNLNVSFAGIEGESLLVGLDDVAVSSGAACTSVNPEPSHVLRAIGTPDHLARASLRFGLGRTTTEAEVDYVIDKVSSLVTRLRELSPTASPL